MVKQYRASFTDMLPDHVPPAAFIKQAERALKADDNLMAAAQRNPQSLIRELFECARLGHTIGETFHLVPLKDSIEGWEDYRGVIERIYRAGACTSVKVELVKENDEFAYDPGEMDRPQHRVKWFSDRGATVGVYAYAEMVGGGTSKVVVLDRPYLDKVKGKAKQKHIWNEWEDAMILKTAAHRLEPWVPTSSEYLKEKLRAVRDVAAEPAKSPVVDVTSMGNGQPVQVDAEVVHVAPDADAVTEAEWAEGPA
jgi:recombination protein RecT